MSASNHEIPNGEEPLSPAAQWIARIIGRVFLRGRTRDKLAEDVRRLRATGSFPDGSKLSPSPQEQDANTSERRRLAQGVIDFVHNTYKPEETIKRVSTNLQATGKSPEQIAAFRSVYIGEANDRLHAQTAPVIVAEEMRAIFKGGHAEWCRHCGETFLGMQQQRITGAQHAPDITLSLDRFGFSAVPLVEVAEEPQGMVTTVVFTAGDRHTLLTHYETDEALDVIQKVGTLVPYFAEKPPMLEQNRYLAERSAAPQVV